MASANHTMSPEERSERSRLGAAIRWNKDKQIQKNTLARVGTRLVRILPGSRLERTLGKHAHLAANQHIYSSKPTCRLCGKRFKLPA